MTDRRAFAEAGVFDRAWYLHRYGDVAAAGVDPLGHFVEHGLSEGRWCIRFFDPNWYRSRYPDVAAAGADPLLHYIRDGEHEGRQPHPAFDAAWYRSAYAIPDDVLAFGHFVTHRRAGAFVPCADLFAVPLV